MTRNFWEQWLHAWIWLTIGFGALFCGAAMPGLDAGVALFYNIVSGGTFEASGFDAPGMRISVSLVGAVVLGWGLCLLAVYRASGTDLAVWRGLARATMAWYVIDSALSIITGFPLNALSNTLFIALFLVPALKLGFFSREMASRLPA